MGWSIFLIDYRLLWPGLVIKKTNNECLILWYIILLFLMARCKFFFKWAACILIWRSLFWKSLFLCYSFCLWKCLKPSRSWFSMFRSRAIFPDTTWETLLSWTHARDNVAPTHAAAKPVYFKKTKKSVRRETRMETR